VKQNGKGADLHCFVGCSLDEMLRGLSLTADDLLDDPPKPAEPEGPPRVVARYEYVSRDGDLINTKLRIEPGEDGRSKTFRWESGGNPGVLYNLPAVVEADEVHLCEGEKAADRLMAEGEVATCPPAGWQAGYAEALNGKSVTIWQDHDEAGQRFAEGVFSDLKDVAKPVRIVQSKDTTPKADAFDHLEAGHALADAVQIVPAPGGNLESLAFTGQRLLDLLKRPEPEPIYAGIPVPGHFRLIVAPSFVGKTSAVLWGAAARAAGVAPWLGAPTRPAGRVLLLSIDEAPEQLARRLRGLALYHPAGKLESYAGNLLVVGPDRDVDPTELEALRFTDDGLAVLEDWIRDSKEAASPIVEVSIDAYADMLPIGESENSNEEGTRIGGALERIAVQTGVAITLLHHAGKPRPDRVEGPSDIRFLGRGASALTAKARIITALEEVAGFPHLRRVRTITNLGRAPKDLTLEVCSPEAETPELIYFKMHDPLATYRPRDYIDDDEELSTNSLAWRLTGKEPEKGKQPPGEAKRLAAELRGAWLEEGLVDVRGGRRRAKMVRLRRGAEA
jgi:hypothetical protein